MGYNLAPICTDRGLFPVPVILPKSALLCVVLGPPNNTQLGAFEAEARISKFPFSRIAKLFRIEMSSLTVKGLRKYDFWRGVSP